MSMHTKKGTTALPTYSFNEDTDTGVHSSAANTLDFVVGGVSVAQVSGTAAAITFGPVVKLTETVARASFTDGGGTSGTYTLTAGTIPIGATVLNAAVTAVTGFTGDTSAVLTIGDGTDVDRYNTSTVNVFTTASGGVAAGIPSGVRYHDTAKSVVLTITSAADFTSVSAGSVTVEITYIT